MPAEGMLKVTIDGKMVEVKPGTTVLQACEQAAAPVPFYCYHPGLSIAGNCRICLVEIEKTPKLAIACYTQAANGMVVHTQNDRVKQGRQSVLEFLLVNHPLDCPVCDQAGECWLQDYYMEYGLYDPRFNEQKVKKPKRTAIGPHVMLDAERCILCSRCVRFCDEVTKTGELGIFQRGDHSEIGIYPGKELTNAYSGNVVDICPVGALTDRDFRFKCRVWYLGAAPSVCTGCSRGCNIEIHYNREREVRPHIADGDRVMRLKPRYNADVNKWWMCDEGRYSYKFIDHGRLTAPQVRQNGKLVDVSWDDAVTEAASAMLPLWRQGQGSRVAVLASAQLTNEDLFVVRKFFKEKLNAGLIDTPPTKPGSSDDILIQTDKNPNTQGAQAMDLVSGDADSSPAMTVRQALLGQIDVLYVFGWDLAALLGASEAKRLAGTVKTIVFQGSNRNGTLDLAHVVLPSATYAEKDGTFTNFEGRVQRIRQAVTPLGESRGDWEIVQAVAQRLGIEIAYDSSEAIFRALAASVPAFGGMTYAVIGDQGVVLQQAAAVR